jgi:hypothetical protein
MSVKIRKRGGKWYVFVNYHGHRKAKCVGTSRELAEQVGAKSKQSLPSGTSGSWLNPQGLRSSSTPALG